MFTSILGVATQPPDARAIFDRAAAALAAGDLAQAEAGFLEVLTAEPGNLAAQANLGVVYSRMERFDQAIAVYRRVLEQRPRAEAVRLNLALAYTKQDRFADALPLVAPLASEQAQEIRASCLVELRRAEDAIRVLDTLPPSASRWYLRGVALLQKKDSTAAAQAFAAMTEALGDPARAELLLGRAYYQAERFAEARASFTSASRNPTLEGEASRELGKACVSLRDHLCAEVALRRALAIEPRDTEARYFLGSLLANEKKFAEAIPLLEAAQRERPGFWAPHYYLGKARLQQGQASVAIPLLKQAALLNEGESAIWYQLSLALRQTGRVAEAQAAAARVRQLKAQ